MPTRRKRHVTLADVASTVGVSATAASYALNGRPGVSDATRQRVREAAERLGWQPHAGGRALAQARAFAVGLVHNRPAHLLSTDPFFASFLAGLEEALAPRGTSLLLRVIGEETDETQVYRRLAGSGMVDGFVLTDVRRRDPRPGWADELGIPAVALSPPRQDRSCSWVWVDDRGGVRAAVDHLLTLGHREIAHVSGPEIYVHARSRAVAWRHALRRSGLRTDRCEVGDFTAEGGAAATKRLIDASSPPTAIVYANDLMALAGISVLTDAGFRVPEDVSIVGFDDAPIAAYLRPPLTSVRADVHEWARTAGNELLDRIEGAPPNAIKLAPAQLVLRGSTAAPPTHANRPRNLTT